MSKNKKLSKVIMVSTSMLMLSGMMLNTTKISNVNALESENNQAENNTKVADNSNGTEENNSKVTEKPENISTDNSIENPITSEPVTENPVTENPVKEEPIKEEPVKEKPVKEEPVKEKPVTENPTTEKPVTENPTTEKPVTEKPVTENPTTEKPVKEKPVTEKPIKENPVTKKPVTKNPVTEKPVAKKPVAKKPVAKQLSGGKGKIYKKSLKKIKEYSPTKEQAKLLKIDIEANKKLLKDIKKSTSNLTSDYSSATNWADFDIRSANSDTVTAERMNDVIKVMGKTEKMRNSNLGDLIMKASEKYGINAGILFAMTQYETAWGGSNLFNNLNNTGGMECMSGYECEGRWTKFDSLEESIDRKAQLLAGHLYVGDGLVTLNDVINRYAPSFENDVNLYINTLGHINEVYLGQYPITIKDTKLITEINADEILRDSDATVLEIKEALKQLQLAMTERDIIDSKISERKEAEKQLKELLKEEKEKERQALLLQEHREMLDVRDTDVEKSITIYEKGQLDEILTK